MFLSLLSNSTITNINILNNSIATMTGNKMTNLDYGNCYREYGTTLYIHLLKHY